MRYFNTVTKNEVDAVMQDVFAPNVEEMPEPNPYYLPLPAGQRWTFDGMGLVDGTEPIPISVAEQAKIDLQTAGITPTTLALAYYKNHRGDATLLATVDGVVDAVVISSGLSLTQVSELV